MFGAIRDRWVRATELADAAKATGQRWITPELGVGEFLRGFIGAPLAKSDASDPEFEENLKTQIKYDVKPENRDVFDRDFKQINEAQAPSPQEVEQEQVQAQAQAEAQAKAAWLHKTRNSPAARSGAFTDDQRWNTQKQHQDWKSHRKAGTLDDFAKKYPQSQTAKERAMNNRILSPMDMDY